MACVVVEVVYFLKIFDVRLRIVGREWNVVFKWWFLSVEKFRLWCRI